MPASESEPAQAGQTMHEALGVRLVLPPPEDFDPVRASDSELRRYGYPARPDIELHPELHERWKQLMSRPISFIEPEFAVTGNRRYGRRDLVAPTEESWSGSVQYSNPDNDPVKFVSGQWTIPRIVHPESYSGVYALGTWVGIDGGPPAGNGFGSTDVLQAGTGQEGDLWGTKTYAWFEWYSDTVQITNQLVRPGDTMWCSITVHSPTEATVFMWNITTSVATSTIHTATGGKRLKGDTVEWILETPSYSVHNQDVPGVLAKYGKVYFDQCIAFTNNGVLQGGRGVILDQTDVNGQIISAAVPITDQLFEVGYVRTFT